MWAKLMEDTTGLQTYWYGKMDDLFRQRSSVTTCSSSDVIKSSMNRDEIEDDEMRHKLLHTLGVVGSVEY